MAPLLRVHSLFDFSNTAASRAHPAIGTPSSTRAQVTSHCPGAPGHQGTHSHLGGALGFNPNLSFPSTSGCDARPSISGLGRGRLRPRLPLVSVFAPSFATAPLHLSSHSQPPTSPRSSSAACHPHFPATYGTMLYHTTFSLRSFPPSHPTSGVPYLLLPGGAHHDAR